MLALLWEIVSNYVVIQAAIILFALPFYLLYRRRHPDSGEVKVGFNRHLEYFFASPYANWLIFFWAAGEAVVWFVIPEFLLLLVVFMRLKRKGQLLIYDIAGTLAGALVAFMIHLPPAKIAELPYITSNMITQTQVWYERHGLFGLIYQPFSGVPFKVFTHLAADYGFFLLAFLAVAVIVRISRYYIAYVIFEILFPYLHPYVYRNYIKLCLIATFIFSLLLLRVSSTYGPGYKITAETASPAVVSVEQPIQMI